MKHKLKEFLNKRVISTAISAAMTFNMVAILPMSVFADDNSSDENKSKVTSFDGNRYQLFDKSMSWTEAKEYCENLGGHLATITSSEEQEFINESLLSIGEKSTYFIGLSRTDANSQWNWVTGEAFEYTNWDIGEPNSNSEHYVHMYRTVHTLGTWNNTLDYVSGTESFATANAGFICEWEGTADKIEEVSPYTLFSGSSTGNFQLNCWKSTFNGNVYTGAGFVSNASELYLNGKVDAVNTITTNGWQININERNENADKESMPDWDARIHKMAGAYEFSDEDVVRIQDKNVIDGAVKTTGNVEISGTTFDGNCYIIADGDITYNVNDFISTGRVVLYSRNGNITINGTNIDMNGIMYAPNGTVAFNSNIANINGRIFADKINFSGSIFNVTGSDSDWELLGTKTAISKTYTLDDDFKEGEFDGLGLDIADELTLDQRSDNDNVPSENNYKIDGAANGIGLTVKSDKSSLDKSDDTVNLEFDLGGFGSQEVEENNVDLAIVVDNSGSMSGSRRTNAQNAAREVVARMKENDRCAIIKFTSGATVLQDFTNNYELLDTAINKLRASGSTNIASGINKAISCFGNLEDNSRQKYIILLSDGSDSSKSAQAALDAYAHGIRIFALSIGNDSKQMQTIAANSNGIYLNSPTAEQINVMMQQFAAEVFDTAGKDVSFKMTVSKKTNVDISAINPQPTEIIENEDGTKTLKWSYEKISIDENQKVTIPVSVNDLESGLFNIADNVSCTYFNRNGESSTVYADDIVMPVHSYKESGVWTAVYDSKTVDTVWKNIYWNGKLYDDGMIAVKACAGNDENAFGDWVDITNYADIENLSGRYVKVSVEMNVSSTGKTPELFDITVLYDGSDNVNYINNAPETKIVGSDTTCVSKRLFLSSETADDAFCTQLDFKWSCDNENVIIGSSNKPYASFKFNESGEYTVNEIVTVELVYSDNLNITDQQAAIDGVQMTIENDRISAEGLSVGTHQVVWQVQDECGAVFTGTLEIEVADSTAPDVSVTLSDNNPKEGDTVTAEITANDEHGIASVTAKLDGNEINVNDSKAVLENLTAGKHTLEVTAADTVENYRVYTYEFNVLSNQLVDTTAPELDVTVEFTEDKNIEITAVATDDSGNAVITGTVNGEEVVFENGKAVYTPAGVGDYVIVVRAEDESGNYTEKTQTVTITEEDPVFELKLGVTVEKDNIKPDETTNLFVSTSSILGEVSLSCTANGGTVTENEDGFSFVSDKTGTFELVVTATDKKGNSVSQTVYITVTEEKIDIGDDDEETGDYENKYTPEPRARVILDSNEKTETKMTEEMADLVDHLKTPLAVYEYLYNNLNTEYYIGSRKGSIGAYEQKGGNDVDCSSLLIAMLRYLGYEADYVTGQVVITSDQLMGFTATDSVENAEKIYMMLGRPLTRSNGKYIIERTWVKAVIDGKEYQLDVNFKKFTPAGSISDEIKAQNFDLDFNNYTTLSEADALFNEYKNQASLTDINLSSRKLINRRITKLPLNLPYICGKILEETHNIYESTIVTTDSITIYFGGKDYSVTAPRAYISPISIEYVPSGYFYDLYDGIIDKPSSIYASNNDYFTANQKTIAPALYIDNKKVYEWNSRVAIGDKQQMVIVTNTSGQERRYTESRELIVGSIVSIVVDTQVISPQSLLTAYEN